MTDARHSPGGEGYRDGYGDRRVDGFGDRRVDGFGDRRVDGYDDRREDRYRDRYGEGGQGDRYARELERHLDWLDTFTSTALGVLASASGIYTYLGVRTLLDQPGIWTTLAALAYAIAVSVGIFVFWSYLLRLLPAVRSAASRLGLLMAMALGSLAIVAMSSWLNAAALAGGAAVETHMAATVQNYQASLERAHANAVAGQSLSRDVARVRQSFAELSQQEAGGTLSGFSGRGAVFRVLTQKEAELAVLETQLAEAEGPIEETFAQGNALLSDMRSTTVGSGALEDRTVQFSGHAVELAGLITRLRQLNPAPLVSRAAKDLTEAVVLPELDGSTPEMRQGQSSTITSVLSLVEQRARTLTAAAAEVEAMPVPDEAVYAPLSAADAVIQYARNFVPAWAGAISIDLLPAVLVFIMVVVQAAIRHGRGVRHSDDRMTVGELRAALAAADLLRDYDDGFAARRRASFADPMHPASAPGRQPDPFPDPLRDPPPDPMPDPAPDPAPNPDPASADKPAPAQLRPRSRHAGE